MVSKRTVVVVSALREELDPLLLDKTIQWTDAQASASNLWYYEGLLENTDITIIAASALEMGLTTTAIIVTKLIASWNPILVVMIGICAGRADKGVRIGDIVVPNKVIHYQFGTFEGSRVVQRPLAEETNHELHNLASSLSTRGVLEDIDTGYIGDKPTEGRLKGHYYPLASADWVVKDSHKLDETRFQDQDVVALDMESYSVVYAANRLKVPYGAVIVKSVSDYADSAKSDRFRDYAKYTSASFFVRLLLEFAEAKYPPSTRFRTQDQTDHARASNCVLILSAQNQDIDYFRQQSDIFVDTWHEAIDTFEHPYYINTLNSIQVIATSMPRSGLTAAAIITTSFIERFKPELVFVIGTCGGRKEKVRIGDIVIPNKVFHYQYGAFRDGQIDSELWVGYPDDWLIGFVETLPEQRKRELATQIHETFRFAGPDKQRPSTLSDFRIAPMASADLIVRDTNVLEIAAGLDRKVVAIDMEGYAILRAARHALIPPKILLIRTVADYADAEKDDTYRSYARYASVRFCASLLPEVLLRLPTQAKRT